MEENNKTLLYLCEEVDRLIERYMYDPIAIEALEQVKWWAQEESILCVDE